MKVLAIADQESASLWDFFQPEKIKDVELILSCGDLAPEYLSFLATYAKAPVLYVHGNHDDCYERKPPLGCICIENQIYHYKGIRILGLGGSMRYNDGKHQYTEQEMESRVRRLKISLFFSKGFDILLTHSPALGLGDGKDLPHKGFQVFHKLLKQYEPAFFVHGHTHLNYSREYKCLTTIGNTQIINAFERYEFEVVPQNTSRRFIK